jgi:hypothetical protein
MSEHWLQIGLIFFGALNLAFGIVMMLAPGWFFDHVGPYGIDNHHYIGDLGAFYIAAGGGLLVSVRRRSWRAPLLYVSAAWYGLHAVNHLFDIGENNRSDSRGIADTVSIAIGALALAYMARAAYSAERGEIPAPPSAGLPPRPPDYPPGD